MARSFMTGRPLSDQQLDRAAGVLLAAACGDALGVPYEFGAALPEAVEPAMVGGGLGPYEPGEFSDDGQMAVCVAEVTSRGVDVRTAAGLDQVAERFLIWFQGGATDVGAQTRRTLSAVARSAGAGGRTAGLSRAMTAAAARLHRSTGRTAGNGSLMRTEVLALAYLDDPEALANAARSVSALTHADDLAGDACVLWTSGIRTAVVEGHFEGVRDGLPLLPAERRHRWSQWLSEAESSPPTEFRPHSYVVRALQAAWSAIKRTPVPRDDPGQGSFACQHLTKALKAAVRAGDDTDTVGAIAGAMLGARWGASAVPLDWQRVIHGWPGCRASDLVRLAVLTVRGGLADDTGWPDAPHSPAPSDARTAIVPHPCDDGVLLGSILHAADPDLSGGVDALVSLCRTGPGDTRRFTGDNQAQAWLVDLPGRNQHPHFVVDQAARTVAQLRAEGKRVLLGVGPSRPKSGRSLIA